MQVAFVGLCRREKKGSMLNIIRPDLRGFKNLGGLIDVILFNLEYLRCFLQFFTSYLPDYLFKRFLRFKLFAQQFI